MSLYPSNLVIHLNTGDEVKRLSAEDGQPVGPDDTDEEFFDVVVLPPDAPGDPTMVTMTEATLASLVGLIAGYRDHTIVPKE